VLPVFRSLEDFDRPADELHGVGGPVRVMTRYEPHPMLAAMVAASQEAGVPFNDDHNGETLDGVGYSQLTIRNGVRETGASAFIDPVADDPRLQVHTGAQVLGLRFAGGRCTGVEVDGGVIEADREVVLCAGTLESPKLLMLAGIGPVDELARHGIGVRVDTPTCSGAAVPAWRCPTPSRCASTSRCTTTPGWRGRPRPTRSTAASSARRAAEACACARPTRRRRRSWTRGR
jgi:choline dehydrogenase